MIGSAWFRRGSRGAGVLVLLLVQGRLPGPAPLVMQP